MYFDVARWFVVRIDSRSIPAVLPSYYTRVYYSSLPWKVTQIHTSSSNALPNIVIAVVVVADAKLGILSFRSAEAMFGSKRSSSVSFFRTFIRNYSGSKLLFGRNSGIPV